MKSRRIFAAALAATLTVGSASAVAFAEETAATDAPAAKSFKVTDATGSAWFSEVKGSDNTVEVTPTYDCYGAEKDGKIDAYVDVVTDIDYSDAFNTTYDSELKDKDTGCEYNDVGGKLAISLNVNAADYGKTSTLKFQDKENFYTLNIKNNGYVGSPVLTATVSGMDGAVATVNGTEVTFTIPEGATINAFQTAMYTVNAEVKLGDKTFKSSYKGFLGYVTDKGSEYEITNLFSTDAVDSIVPGASEKPVYAYNYKLKFTAKCFNQGQEIPEPTEPDPGSPDVPDTPDTPDTPDEPGTSDTEKPDVTETVIKGVDKAKGVEGDALNEILFGDSGKTWADVEKVEFTSDGLFSLQFSTTNETAGTTWFTMGKDEVPAARADDDKQWATSWTITENEMALFDTTKNGGAWVKVIAKDEPVDIKVNVSFKADAPKPDDSSNTETPGNNNPNTGIALAIAPAILAAGAVVVVSTAKKRK